MKRFLACSTLFSVLVVGACSSGGGGGGTSPSASTKLTISGTVDSQVTSTNGTSSNPVKGATVNIVDASGNSQTVQTDSTGHYSAQVNKLTIYGVTVAMPTSSKPDDRGVSSPVYMKAVAQVGSNDFVLNVNPGSTAAVLVLQNKYSIKIGDSTSPIGTKLDNVDVDTTVTNIYATPTFTNLAAAVAADVKNNTDPASDTNITTTLVPPVVTQVTPVPTSTAVCPSYQTMISGACVVTSCPAGQTLVNNVCTTPASSGGTTSNTTSLIGTWYGTGAASGTTAVITSSSIVTTGGACSNTSSYTTSGNIISMTITTPHNPIGNCAPAGAIMVGTYSISGSNLTMIIADNTTAPGGPYINGTVTFTNQAPAASNDPALVGTWEFIMPNNSQFSGGYAIFAQNSISMASQAGPVQCTAVSSLGGSTLTVTSLSSPPCQFSAGSYPYTISGNILNFLNGNQSYVTTTGNPTLVGPTWWLALYLVFTSNTKIMGGGGCGGEVDSYTTGGGTINFKVTTAAITPDSSAGCPALGSNYSWPYSISGSQLTVNGITFTKQ